MVDYALELLSHGFLCVPVSRGGRHLDIETIGYAPLHLQTRHKYLKELCFDSIVFHLSQQPPSAETLKSWFDGYEGNIGIIGGYRDLVILDFDSPSIYRRWKRENESLAASTPVAKSPHGFHVYLKMAVPIISSSLHFGFRRAGHVKALGGYVLSAPSKLKEGLGYNWLPNQSPFDVVPRTVESLQSLSLSPASRLKVFHDRLLGRGRFEPN
ncbi:MAG: bifunctional DNA primase/polymerase [Verrucomicrobia bacterium]|nr:bifunctional DNA primase/polymerase [Verrucomicrobiota bacterium]